FKIFLRNMSYILQKGIIWVLPFYTPLSKLERSWGNVVKLRNKMLFISIFNCPDIYVGELN
ncbi:MAG: hypothetical protein COX07_01325, partial [Bacteroidetes bacterium CG23_combo_of_CG06-09_8_20_14_all_32_9]